MRILVIGHNRSGTTLILFILMKLLKYQKIDINKLIDDSSNKLDKKDFIGFPSLSKATISRHIKTNDSISYTTKFNCIYSLKNLPENSIFRVNQLSKEDLELLSYFDIVIHIKRIRLDLLLSNLLDLPPAFEILSLINFKTREKIAKGCISDIGWLSKMNKGFNIDNEIFEAAQQNATKHFCLNFENLIKNPKNVLMRLINELELKICLDDLDQVLINTINKPLSTWKTHLNDSSEDLKSKIKLMLQEIDLEAKSSMPQNDSNVNEILVKYKKLIYNSEFSLSFEEYKMKDNKLGLYSSFNEHNEFHLSLHKYLK